MKVFEQFRAKRQKTYEKLFSAKALCIAGLLIMPAFLFNPFTPFRILLFLFFWFLAWLCGKKNNPLITITVILFIVAFNLIVPHGQVLFVIGGLRITSGALLLGIQRAVTLAGLIMLSRVTIRHDLKIPGLFGELIGESFRLFSIMMNKRQRITRKNLISDIDQMMVELSNDSAQANALALKANAAPVSRTKLAGFLILAVAVLLPWVTWLLWFWPQIMHFLG